MNETNQKGLMTELHCQLDFSNLGILLSAPITSDSRYDYIADIDGKLIKIQCKTSSVSENKDFIKFSTRSVRKNAQETKYCYYNKEQIDYFYTYYDNQGYLIKVENVAADKILRFSALAPRSNISWATDFELEKVLKKDFNFEPTKIEVHQIIDKIKSEEEINRLQECPQRPEREELKKLVREKTFVDIGKQFLVSDKVVVGWLKNENLPFRKKDIILFSDEDWEAL